MKIKTFIIDAFTDEPFRGNPAGVCLLETELSETVMQSIASEINLSETAFLLPAQAETNHFSIRYFTPTIEIPFCGHATLASSKVALDYLGMPAVDFTTHYGLQLSALKDGGGIAMKFPLYDTEPTETNPELLHAFGITHPLAIRWAKDVKMLLVEVADKETLLSLQPDYEKALRATHGLNNLIVTTRSWDNPYDFYSRCFCPWIGINEDPVTGASHAVLAKYWGQKLNKTDMKAYQLSKRGGYLNLTIVTDNVLEVRSNAKIMLEGNMAIAG